MQQRKRLKKASDGKSGAPEEALSDDDDLFSENSPEKQTRTATNPSSLVTFEHVQGKKKLMKPTSARNHDDDDDNFLNSEDLEAKNLSQTSKAKPTTHKAVDIIAAEGAGNDTDDEAENETFLTSLQHPQLESIIEADDSRALGCALINRDFTFVEFPDEIRQKKGSKHQILDMFCLCLAAASAGAEKCLEFLLLAIDEVGGREGTHLKSKSISSTAIQSKIAALVQQSEEKEGKDKQSSDTTASPIASSSSSSLSSSAISSGHQRRLYIHIGNACDILLSMNNRNFLPPDALGGTGAGTSSSGKQLPCAYHSAIQMHAPPLLLVAMRKGHIEVIRLLCESYPLHSLTLLSDPVDVSATAVLDTEGAPVVSSLFTFVGEHTFPGVLVALMTIDKAIMTLRTSLSLTSSGASSLVHINNKGVDVNSASKGVLLQIMSEEYQELQSVKVIELLKKKNNDGSNLLLWAAEEGLADFVDALLHMVPELIAQVDKAGITPLHSACMMGHVEVLHVLLRHDIDIFVADRRGWTGLLYALLRENVPCVLELLKANTDGALQHIQVRCELL
jgi:ankyrin repeat protein